MDTETIVQKIKENSFYTLKNYFTKEECDEIISEIDNNLNSFTKGDGNDFRYHYFERLSPLSKKFLDDEGIQEICNEYMQVPIIEKRCQAGLVVFEEGKDNCSGGGWHVDGRKKQFKAIMYLNEVDDTTGPFTIIPNTHQILENIETVPKYEGDTSRTRFVESELEKRELVNNKKVICGNQGDLILVDTSHIHRGAEISQGKRYTLTIYFYN